MNQEESVHEDGIDVPVQVLDWREMIVEVGVFMF